MQKLSTVGMIRMGQCGSVLVVSHAIKPQDWSISWIVFPLCTNLNLYPDLLCPLQKYNHMDYVQFNAECNVLLVSPHIKVVFLLNFIIR